MKVLFAVSNDDISESIVKKYQQEYKEIIVGKNVYYFNAILKELQKDKSYDRIVVSEELEPFTNNNYDTIDNFIFEKLDNISDEAVTNEGEDIPIILIATDRRTKKDSLLSKLFGIGIYSALIGQDRSIDEVCRLINKPRLKKEAKLYYKLDSNEVEYKPENDDVSETEIQNILIHYQRLGKNEDRYVESFENIAAQYTDEQLKVIIKFLPLNVKAVLEEKSSRYQQLMSFGNGKNKNKNKNQLNNYGTNYKSNVKNNITKAVNNSGITVESIPSQEKKITKPVIIPSVNNVKRVENTRKVQQVQDEVIKKLEDIDDEEEFEEIEPIEQIQPKRGRGRPRKIQPVLEQEEVKEVKRRGRPRKIQPIIEEIDEDEVEEIEEVLPGFEDYEDEETVVVDEENYEEDNDNYEDEDEVEYIEEDSEEDEDIEEDSNDEVLPGFEEDDEYDDNNYDYEEDEELPEIDENINEEMLPGFENVDNDSYNQHYENENEDDEENNDEQDENDEEMLPGFENVDNNEEDYGFTGFEPVKDNYYEYEKNKLDENNESTDIDYYNKPNYEVNLENLLTKDKKIVSVVGTSKNGTSFIVNNLAEILSKQGIKTAVLDLTKNRNSYYIYTKNEEELRKIAFSSITKLIQGTANGIRVNNCLDVYTALPGEDVGIENCGNILETLVKNYSLILLDCDFLTPYEYLRQSQEIYLVQSMDVLTIQPITAYLRELKAKGILDQNKLRVVINKYVKVKSVTEKAILGGMAFYNDPAMSYMTELFNREIIPYCTIPFDMQVYARYLEGLINCDVTVNGYPKEILGALKKLASTVYPLIDNNSGYTNEKYRNPKYNKYANQNNFSDEMNSTINKMRNNY